VKVFAGAIELLQKRDLIAEPVISLPGGTAGDVWFFSQPYGNPQDCPSGCFYSSLVGLMNGDTIAWIEIYDHEELDFSDVELYQFDTQDSYLFRPEMLRAFEALDHGFFHSVFLYRIAESTEVGVGPLASVAYELFDYIAPRLAETLISNPVVRADQEVLFTLAGLPHFEDDPYANVRLEARSLLGVLTWLPSVVSQGVGELDDKKLPSLIDLKYDTVADAVADCATHRR
jgi:hypothetical protein